MTQVLELVFYLPGIFFLISGVPQTIKLLKTKSSEDISISMYVLTCLGIAIVVVNAYMSKNTSILVSNLASLAITATNTFLVIKYQKEKPLD